MNDSKIKEGGRRKRRRRRENEKKKEKRINMNGNLAYWENSLSSECLKLCM